MADKLIITADGVFEEVFTPEELQQIEEQKQLAEQQAQIDLLKPSQEEVDKAERQINLINDLTELGVIL